MERITKHTGADPGGGGPGGPDPPPPPPFGGPPNFIKREKNVMGVRVNMLCVST